MMRRAAPVLILAAILGIVFPVPGMAGLFDRTKISAGLGAEFFSRSLKSDDSPTLNSAMGTISVEFAFPSGLDIGLFAGGGRSTFKGMIFEELPISLEYQGGAASGWIFGGEIRKSFIEFGNFEMGGAARGVFSLGMDKSWPLTGFAVEGQATGNPKWTEWSVGPLLIYKGYEKFTPSLGIFIDGLSGRFRMMEALGDLRGVESKDIKGRGFIRVSLGTAYEISTNFRLRAEASMIPGKGGVDTGAFLRVFYFF